MEFRKLLIVALVFAWGSAQAALAEPSDNTVPEQVQAIASGNLLVAIMAEKMQVAAVPYCQKHMRISGLVFFDRSQFDRKLGPMFAQELGLGALPTVISVVPDSPADKAGIQPRDQIVAINGQDLASQLPVAKDDKPTEARFVAVRDKLTAAFDAGPVHLSLLRADKPLNISFSGDLGCESYIQIDSSGTRNASTDGENVTIDWGIFQAVENDDQLAFVIAHELSHNFLGHREYLDSTRTGDGILAGFGRNGARIRKTERQADYLGLYLMAWAGYDPHAASLFWMHMAHANPLGFLSWDGTHSTSGERARMLEKVADEIDIARAAGRAPVPNFDAFEAAQGA